jgi:hypothetical protein
MREEALELAEAVCSARTVVSWAMHALWIAVSMPNTHHIAVENEDVLEQRGGTRCGSHGSVFLSCARLLLRA